MVCDRNDGMKERLKLLFQKADAIMRSRLLAAAAGPESAGGETSGNV